jgi:hypothetical protein
MLEAIIEESSGISNGTTLANKNGSPTALMRSDSTPSNRNRYKGG